MVQNPSLYDLISAKIRFFLYLSSLSSLIFVENYCTNVCPFIDGLSQHDIYMNLTLVFFFHIAVRELLYYRFRFKWDATSLPRQAYYLSILSWALAGVAALVIHDVRYPDFPFGSHVKMLSSYWLLGAGILSQFEYVLFEYQNRRFIPVKSIKGFFSDRISRRILESLLIFTLVPSVTMILIILRYDHAGTIIHKVTVEVLYIGIFCIAMALFISILFGRMLERDARRIVQAVGMIEKGDFNPGLKINRSDELGEISEGINLMADGLIMRERIRDAFGRFVDPKVAETFINEYAQEGKRVKMGGRREEVAILMADIREFTPLAESMPPDRLIGLLNEYFKEMVGCIKENNGIVDKFIGDAIMGVFGLAGSSHAEQDALRAAIQMQERLAVLNRDFARRDMPLLETGIGLHCGEVVSGYVGSEDRLEFTIIGSSVNVTARVESETKRLDIPLLFSESFAKKVSPVFRVRFVEEATLKGVSARIKLYTLDGTIG